MESIKVFAPASVSNVGPGFDIMGFALNEPGDEIILRKSKTEKIEITKITGDGGKLPLDPQKNTATVAIKYLLNTIGIKAGLKVEIRKKMGIGSGLGSSAASAVGAVFAANELLGLKLSRDKLLKPAMHGEYIASKAMHADNVAPALYGGFILIRCYNPIDIVKVPVAANLYCCLLYPDIEIKTSEARKLVKKSVRIHSAISQAGNSASLITALLTKDYKLLSRSIVDNFAEPYRSQLVSGYNEIRNAALKSGALNCNITGSGPSMFAFCRSKSKAENIVKEMKKASAMFTKRNTTYISKINMNGPKILN